MRRIMLLAAALVLLIAPAAQAQDSWPFRTFAPGGLAPISTFVITPASVVCNLAPPAPGASRINPTKIAWDDPANAGKVCQFVDSGTGPLFALPKSPTGVSYESTLEYVNAAGASGESLRSLPFTEQTVGARPTGLLVWK